MIAEPHERFMDPHKFTDCMRMYGTWQRPFDPRVQCCPVCENKMFEARSYESLVEEMRRVKRSPALRLGHQLKHHRPVYMPDKPFWMTSEE